MSAGLTTEESNFSDFHDKLEKRINLWKIESNRLNNNQRKALNILICRRFNCKPIPDILPWMYRFLIGIDYGIPVFPGQHIIAKNLFLPEKWVCNCHHARCEYLIRMKPSLMAAFD